MLNLFWIHHLVDLHVFWFLSPLCCKIFYLFSETEPFYVKMSQENIYIFYDFQSKVYLLVNVFPTLN